MSEQSGTLRDRYRQGRRNPNMNLRSSYRKDRRPPRGRYIFILARASIAIMPITVMEASMISDTDHAEVEARLSALGKRLWTPSRATGRNLRARPTTSEPPGPAEAARGRKSGASRRGRGRSRARFRRLTELGMGRRGPGFHGHHRSDSDGAGAARGSSAAAPRDERTSPWFALSCIRHSTYWWGGPQRDHPDACAKIRVQDETLLHYRVT